MSEYDEDLELDKNDLDSEWIKQPSLVFKYGELLASAQRTRDRLKEDLDLEISRLDNQARKDPEGCGVAGGARGNPTETSIRSWINTQSSVAELNSKLLEASYDVSILQAAYNAIQVKTKALQNVVSLFLANYYVDNGEVPQRRVASERSAREGAREQERHLDKEDRPVAKRPAKRPR